MFPLIDTYILMLLQFSQSANIGPALPPTPHMSPGNYVANLAHEPTVELEPGSNPYGMDPVIPQMQMNSSDFIHAPPHGLAQIDYQEGVAGEWTYGTGSAGTFSFPS